MAIKIKNLSGVQSAIVSLSTDLSMRIRDDILTGRLRNNQKLTEQDICNTYSVSRTPVREALAQLEAEGLVESIPNRGAFVVGLSSQDIEDILVLRKIYEVQATAWAIERITDEELDKLEENYEFMEFYTMKKDVEKMLNINQNFHQIIYNATHNKMLIRTLSSYQMYVKHFRSVPENPVDYLNGVLEEHKAIFNAFRYRNVELGVKAMAAHMDLSMERIHG